MYFNLEHLACKPQRIIFPLPKDSRLHRHGDRCTQDFEGHLFWDTQCQLNPSKGVWEQSYSTVQHPWQLPSFQILQVLLHRYEGWHQTWPVGLNVFCKVWQGFG